MIASSREEWEKTFNVCWGGVYHSTRAFLPMLQRADESHIVNTSSINGFWASIGPRVPHTAYSAAGGFADGEYGRPPPEPFASWQNDATFRAEINPFTERSVSPCG